MGGGHCGLEAKALGGVERRCIREGGLREWERVQDKSVAQERSDPPRFESGKGTGHKPNPTRALPHECKRRACVRSLEDHSREGDAARTRRVGGELPTRNG